MLNLEEELKRMSEAYDIPEKEVVFCLEEGKRVFEDFSKYETNKDAAKLKGAKFYFPNKPCSRGHIGLRYLSGGCRDCNLIRGRGGVLPEQRKSYGVGYNSAVRTGYKTKENGKITKAYDGWKRMIQRCFDAKYKEDHPTYLEVTCIEDWEDYQNFAKWWYSQPNHDKGFELDKDLLVIGNKLYSPETCCLLPAEINKTLNTRGSVSTWREKDSKFTYAVFGKIVGYEDHYLTKADVVVGIRNDKVKQLADKWKDSLTKEAYEALKNFRFMYSLDGSMYRGFYK